MIAAIAIDVTKTVHHGIILIHLFLFFLSAGGGG